MHRCYSILDVKSVDQTRRIFRGIATTPSFDRVSDRVDPMKANYAREIPLLHAHKHDRPIGVVRLGKATKAGIPFEAEIPVVHEPAALKERVDIAFAEVKHGLVKAVSIGFRATEPPSFNDKGGVDFAGIEILEVSTVAIPAQAEAVIHTVKAFDDAAMAVAGVKATPVPQRVAEKAKRIVKLHRPKKVARVLRLSPVELLTAKETIASQRRRAIYKAYGLPVSVVRLTAEEIARARKGRRS